MKIVINRCHGGYGLSWAAKDWLKERLGPEIDLEDIARNDPVLVECVETLGREAASDNCAELKIVQIPDDVEWEIGEYDGIEWVSEKHQKWS